MIKVLISGMNGVIALELVTNLKKFGYYVIGIDNQEHGFAKKICNEFLRCPKGNSKEFINFIKKVSSKVDAMLFFVDEELINISNNLKNKHIQKKIVISKPQTINMCVKKNILNSFLKKKNILIPPNSYKGNVFIKPIIGRGSKNSFFTNSVKIINAYKKDKKFLIQRYIEGDEYTVDCIFNKNNKLIFSLPRKRVVASNVSIVNSIENNKELTNLCNLISKYISFYGPINFQFIIEKKTNKIWLIEINPRLAGGSIFSILSGFQVLDISIKLHLNLKFKIKKKIKYGSVFARYLKSEEILLQN